MSNQRYTPVFKDEAVSQFIDRGHTVAEVADRLGVSAHSLYKWVAAMESFFGSLKKERIKNGYIKLVIWHVPMHSILLNRSTIERADINISVISVLRRMNKPQFEAGACHQCWGISTHQIRLSVGVSDRARD